MQSEQQKLRKGKPAISILGQDDEAVENYVKVYEVSDKKAQLATKVAEKELSLISDIDVDNDYCLYVGIPFCPTRCLYCSFTSYPIAQYEKKAAEYIKTLKKELDYIAEVYKDKRLVSVYIGGGTPTSISHELLDELLTHIDSAFDLSQCKEFTVEAGRPDSITKDKLMVMKNHNISRISINPQTMNDETLKVIGRAHTVEQTVEAFKLARECGFDNINMDLIAGLPGEDIKSMENTLAQIKELAPESLTVHSLAIKRAANLKQQLGEYAEEIHQDVNEMLDVVSDVAAELGMEPYYLYRQKNIGGNLENVGYSKEGLECLYNILIMEEITDIIAAGAGASTKVTYHAENRVERVENCKSVDDYITRFDEMLERKKKEFK
ncbi:MAG: coproporphyrinogen dehydrogenase HemZ [Lachnospiraceae bacterium]|nr:coproporphyrinogen dehydrogenase HemZ [Lachnospiraceae bacterium]